MGDVVPARLISLQRAADHLREPPSSRVDQADEDRARVRRIEALRGPLDFHEHVGVLLLLVWEDALVSIGRAVADVVGVDARLFASLNHECAEVRSGARRRRLDENASSGSRGRTTSVAHSPRPISRFSSVELEDAEAERAEPITAATLADAQGAGGEECAAEWQGVERERVTSHAGTRALKSLASFGARYPPGYREKHTSACAALEVARL